MDESIQYGQMNMDLPHDVVKLPSGGKFYKNKKSSLKIGYLTAQDENILMSPNMIQSDSLISTLLRQKIYEPGFNVDELLNGDVQAILIFLRNTAFGPEYKIQTTDPKTMKTFEVELILDEVDFKPVLEEPNNKGHFQFKLPKSGRIVECKLLSVGEQKELDKLSNSYPSGMVSPIATKKLEKQIVSLDGDDNKTNISVFISQMPIQDSKFIRNKMNELEPGLLLDKQIIAPSGEKVDIRINFGVEFFRPFF